MIKNFFTKFIILILIFVFLIFYTNIRRIDKKINSYIYYSHLEWKDTIIGYKCFITQFKLEKELNEAILKWNLEEYNKGCQIKQKNKNEYIYPSNKGNPYYENIFIVFNSNCEVISKKSGKIFVKKRKYLIYPIIKELTLPEDLNIDSLIDIHAKIYYDNN